MTGHRCSHEDCDFCERAAEAMRDDREQGYEGDWKQGLDREEYAMDRRGGSA